MITPLRVIERVERPKHREDDRKQWPAGPWDKEPDLVEWRDAATGYPCLVVRGPLGSLCGYVGVPEGHPAHGKPYGELDDRVLAHGGLTYSDACAGHICHVPQPGESDSVWWLGFDCAHGGDLVPGMLCWREQAMARLGHDQELLAGYYRRDEYRTLEYVQEECAQLAAALSELDPGGESPLAATDDPGHVDQ